MSAEPHVCPLIKRYCKHGHLRTNETTFERKAKVHGKIYIVRECRVCHALRSNNAPSWSKGTAKSKWSPFRPAMGDRA